MEAQLVTPQLHSLCKSVSLANIFLNKYTYLGYVCVYTVFFIFIYAYICTLAQLFK